MALKAVGAAAGLEALPFPFDLPRLEFELPLGVPMEGEALMAELEAIVFMGT